MIFKIVPEYRLRNTLRTTLFSLGFALILLDIILKEIDGLYFFSIILFAIGGFISVLSAKQILIIDKKSITVNSKSLFDGDKTIQVDFVNIKKVRFLKKQFLLFGGRSPLADADAQTLYHTNRIVLTTQDNKEVVVQQIGKLEIFKKAFSIIETKISQL